MGRLIVLTMFLFLSCSKSEVIDETTSSVKFILVDKEASTKLTERLCKCIEMKALIYYNGVFVGERDFEAGFTGTLFSGLTANRNYDIIIYTINKENVVPGVSNRQSYSNAKVDLNTNENFMYYKKRIYLNPGSNTISIKMDVLFAEVVFPSEVTATIVNNYNKISISLDDKVITRSNLGSRTITGNRIIINNNNVNSIINVNGSVLNKKFESGHRYIVN